MLRWVEVGGAVRIAGTAGSRATGKDAVCGRSPRAIPTPVHAPREDAAKAMAQTQPRLLVSMASSLQSRLAKLRHPRQQPGHDEPDQRAQAHDESRP
jgi:hypothetical protein